MQDILIQVLTAVAAAVIPIVAGFAVNALQKMAAKNGVELKQAQLDRLNEMLVNGLNAGAATAKQLTALPAGADKEKFIKDQAVAYVQAHGKELLADLKSDLSDPEVQAAIRARIETLITSATAPTPPVLNKETVAIAQGAG